MNVKNVMEQEQSSAQHVRDRKPNLVKSAMGRGKSGVRTVTMMVRSHVVTVGDVGKRYVLSVIEVMWKRHGG